MRKMQLRVWIKPAWNFGVSTIKMEGCNAFLESALKLGIFLQ